MNHENIIRDNPAYAGKTPTPMVAKCHDGTPFLSVEPACGHPNHIHESQLADHDDDVIIVLRCADCRTESEWTVGFFRQGFAKLRADGWLE